MFPRFMPFLTAQKLRAQLTAGLLLLGGSTMVWADMIADWNALALNAAREEEQLSPEVARSLAILHTAIYNAVEGISGNYELYTHGSYLGPSGTAASGASMQAATAMAAYTVLSELYQNSPLVSTFETLYLVQMNSIYDDQAKLDGISFGYLAANDILNWRASDGASAASNPLLYSPVGSVGYWSPTAPGNLPAALPGWGAVNTFSISSTSAYNGSLGMSNTSYLTTNAYAQDYQSVQSLGSVNSGTRNQAQTDSAFFWNGAPGTITNVGIWNQVASTVVSSQGLNLEDSARLYAMLNVSFADAGIVTWDTKYSVDFWSPISAITNGAADGNPLTTQDANWLPLLDSPNYPAYFAEQAAFAGVAGTILTHFGGPNFVFTQGSDTDGDGNIDLNLNFNSFAVAQLSAINSGIYGGIYDNKSATDAATAGSQIGNYVLNNQFSTVPEPAGALLLVLSAGPWLLRRRRGE